MEKILLIDGNSMLFRGYYATCYTRMMKTSSGIPTNAVFAFSTMMDKAIKKIEPKYVVVAFDKGKKTFRHDLYEDYKGGRKAAPEDLVPQFSLVRDFLKAYNIPYIEEENIEADDIIGSLAKKYPDYEVNILTSDRDLLQVIDTTTSVYLMKKGITDMQLVDQETLKEEFHLHPLQIIDLKGLMGDSADNIKGVMGIGEKTALKLLEDYQSIEKIYENIDRIKGKLKEKLLMDKESAFLSKQLATIKTDVSITLSLKDFLFQPNYETLLKFYHQYEMRHLAAMIDVTDTSEITYQVVKKVSKDLLNEYAILDFQRDYFDYFNPNVYGLSIYFNGKIEYIALEDLKQDEEALTFLMSEKGKVVYDVKALYHLMDMIHIPIHGFLYDVMIACFLNDTSLTDYDKMITHYDLKEEFTLKDLFGLESKPKLPDAEILAKHSANRIKNIATVYHIVKSEIQEKEMEQLLLEVELPLAHVLYKMEKEGICINTEVLDQISNDTLNKMQELSNTIYQYVDATFNLNSPKQLAEVLFDKLQLPSNKKRSTSQDILEKLIGKHPIIEDILLYRKYSKLYSTYAEGLKKYVGSDLKIHTIYNQVQTATGRLSSTDPNLQNISVKDEESKEIRKAFIASKDSILLSCDYSQIELRMLAHLAKEEKLIDAFKHDLDIHTKTAMDIFHILETEMTPAYRRAAKAVNFGIIYGMSEFGLSQQIHVSINQAKEFINNYFATYPNIKNYMDYVIQQAVESGYASTILKRRRYIKELKDSNYMMKEFGKRAAMNTPIQGSAADLLKLAMIQIDKKMEGLQSKMILTVHDELIFDVLESEFDQVLAIVLEGMENAMKLSVPLKVSYSKGASWYDAK